MESGATWFDVECLNYTTAGGDCRHERRWSIVHAVAEWGPVELEGLRFVCTHCGSRLYRLNFRHAINQGGNPVSGIEHHAQMYRYHFRHMHRYCEGWPTVI